MDIFIIALLVLLILFLNYLFVKAVVNCFKENPQELLLSEDQKNIRASWKKAFLLSYVSSFLYHVVLIFQHKELEWPFAIGVIPFTILSLLISAYILAYFAYKRCGTKLIGLYVFFNPIISVFALVFFLQEDLLEALFFAIQSIPTAFFWIRSIRMYKLNHLLKRERKQNALQVQINAA